MPSYGPIYWQPIKLQVSLKCNIYLNKEVNNDLYFWHADKYKLILTLWFNMTRHAQSTQNKFAYLSSISRKTWVLELIFLPADKYKYFLQTDSITLGVHSQACPKYPKQQACNMLAISQGKT